MIDDISNELGKRWQERVKYESDDAITVYECECGTEQDVTNVVCINCQRSIA